MLASIERRLREDGLHVLQLTSTREAEHFYLRNGYAEMSFDAPDGEALCADDIPLGKILLPARRAAG